MMNSKRQYHRENGPGVHGSEGMILAFHTRIVKIYSPMSPGMQFL